MASVTVGTWIALASTVATTAYSYVSAKQTADDQEDAERESQKAYNDALLQDTIYQYQELDQEEGKVIYDAHTKSIGVQKQFMQARAQAEAEAGATGMAGQSIDVAIENLKTGYGEQLSDIIYEQESRIDAVNQQATNLANTYTGNYDNNRISTPSTFSLLGDSVKTGVSVGQSVYSIADPTINAIKSSSQATSKNTIRTPTATVRQNSIQASGLGGR